MRSKAIQDYKKSLKINSKQRDMLVGLLLGDGHLETRDNGRTFRLKVDHSFAQREYIEWIYEEFRPWIRQDLHSKRRSDGRESLDFSTYSHGAFRFYAQQFYLGKKKQMPKLLNKILTPLGLAVWFMDDGSLKSSRHNTYIIHTVGWARKDLETAQKVLSAKFGIETSLHRQRDKHLRLYIKSASAGLFRRIIEPYMVTSLRYKLGNVMPKK